MNPFRAEQNLEIGGKQYLLRGSFEAQVEIEDRASCTLWEILMACRNLGLSRRQLASVLYGGHVVGTGAKMTYEECGAAIISAPLADVIIPVSNFITACLDGAPLSADDEKKRKEQSDT